MRGEPMPDARYSGYASCPLITAKNKCILAEFGYDVRSSPLLFTSTSTSTSISTAFRSLLRSAPLCPICRLIVQYSRAEYASTTPYRCSSTFSTVYER